MGQKAFTFLPYGFHGLSSQNRKTNVLLRKVRDLGGKSCIVLDDRGKMDLKDLVTYGREERGSRERGQRGRKQKRERAPRDPVEKGIWER